MIIRGKRPAASPSETARLPLLSSSADALGRRTLVDRVAAMPNSRGESRAGRSPHFRDGKKSSLTVRCLFVL